MADILNDENFEQETSEGIVLIDFYAQWCGPCKMIAPIIEDLSNEIKDAKIVKINVDESPVTTMKFGIRSIPTFILLKNGIEVHKYVGSQSKKSFITMIDSIR